MIEHDIWFSMLKISESTKRSLLKKLGSTENVWNYSRDSSSFLSADRNELKVKSRMSEMSNEKEIDFVKNIVFKNEIMTVNCNEELFPEQLKPLDDCPSMLFYRGDLKKLNSSNNAAVVGSRNCTAYGRSAAASIARDLCSADINVISGLARGIDGTAHKACLANGGFTCGVLGCGLDIVYPKENVSLYNEMFKEGCVVSEFIPGTKPAAYNFPKETE